MTNEFSVDAGLQAAMQLNEKIVALFRDESLEANNSNLSSEETVINEGERVLGFRCDANTLLGLATGMAVYGLQPVVHIAEDDLHTTALQQIRNSSAQFRYRSGGQYASPMTIVVRYRGGITTDVLTASIPGLTVLAPTSELDYTNMLDVTTRMKDPVVIYVPEEWESISDAQKIALETPLALTKARVLSVGTELTLVTYGHLTQFAAQLLPEWEANGRSVEIVDLRSLSPIDSDTVIQSVRKTGRLVILQESARSFGVAAELAAQVSEYAIDSLLAPVRRVAGFDLPDPGALRATIRPDKTMIESAIREVAEFQ